MSIYLIESFSPFSPFHLVGGYETGASVMEQKVEDY